MSTLGKAALVVSGGILASRLLGFVREIVLAGLLGAGAEADLYRAAFTIPDYLFFLMAGGYLTITFVPILTRHLADHDLAAANRSFTAVVRVVGLLMLVLTVATMAAAGPLTRRLFPEIDPGRIPELVGLVRVVLPAQLFFVLGSLLMAYQYSHQRFAIPALAPLVYNLCIILGGLVWIPLTGSAGAAGFIWGALVGAVVGNFGLQWWGSRRLGARLVPGVPWQDRTVGEYFALALPLMIGQSAVALDEVFYRAFGQLGGEGAIASLGYARQVNMVPVGVIAQAAGVASYPFLARMFAEGKVKEMASTVHRALRGGIPLAGLATAALVTLATPVVRLAFQRGRFGPEDTVEVAALLAVYALSVPLWTAHQVYTRGFYAQRRMWLPVGVGTAITVVAIPLYWLGGSRFGAAGIATASVTAMALYTVVIGGWWHRSIPMRPLTGTVLRTLAAAAVAAVAGWLVLGYLPGDPVESGLAAGGSLLVGAIVVLVSYVGVLRLIGAPELAALDPIRRRLRRR